MNPSLQTFALTAAQPTGIALSQSRASAGALTLNGALASAGVATLSSTNCAARRVGITSAGNDSGITWKITGTDRNGNVASETLAGGNATAVQSVRDYATVTSIVSSGATASTVTAGTTATGSTAWIAVDFMRQIINDVIFVALNGTVNYTIEVTPDDPNAGLTYAGLPASLEANSNQPPVAWQLYAGTTSAYQNILIPVFAVRVTITSGTGTATIQYVSNGSSQ